MVVEGDASVVEGLIKKLEAYFSVRDKTVVRLEARGDLSDFEIAH